MTSEARPPAADWDRGSIWLYRAAWALVWTVSKVLFRIRVEGRENLPKRGPFIVAPVHRSYIDTPLAAMITHQRLRYIGKDSLFRNDSMAWFLLSLGGFPVARGTADREALRRCIDVIQRDQPLVMFPEGTRRDGPIVQPLFDGPAYVAGRTQVPIVPVGIGGSERVMPRGSKLLYPRKVVLVVGEPLAAPEKGPDGRVSRSAVRRTTATLHDRLQRLFDEAQIKAGS